MILDTVANSEKYTGLHHRLARAFQYIKNQDLDKLAPGKYSIDGTMLYASVSVMEGLSAGEAKFEAHNKYIDIQVLISGTEQMGWKSRQDCIDPKEVYNSEKDVIFYNDLPDTYVQLKPGQFVVFFPEDVHAPLIGKGFIKKLVVKVKI